MDRKTRKILNRCLHPRSCVARLYMKRTEGGRGVIIVEDCITTERRLLYDYLKESKEDMLSEALKENVIEEGETKEEFSKMKRDESKKARAICIKNPGTLTQVFRKVDKDCVFQERDRGHVICSSGAGTKNQCNQSKDRQTTSFCQA